MAEDGILDEFESSIQIVNTTNTDTSMIDSVPNDDEDSIIPETQDVFSQDSIASLSQNQSDVERKSESEQLELDLSVASNSGHEATQIKAANDKTDMDASQPREFDEKSQTSTASGK